jgi:hypothetical protein
MTRLLPVLLVACAGAGAQVPVEPAKPIVMTPAAQTAPALDAASVTARSHAWFDAYDRDEVARVTEAMAPTFVQFEDGRVIDRARVTKILESHRKRHMPIRSRTWSDEHVFAGENVAIFIGRAVEHVAAYGDNKATEMDGYNTLVWAREGGRWLVAEWQRQLAGIEAERQNWNEVFKHASGFETKPNQLLVDTVKGTKPGTALDIMMGQGRNALYLASQGWRTTGVDISDEGIRQAKEDAARRKLKLDAVQADIEHYDLGTAKWDLVTLIYAGDDAKLVERIKPSLKKGGLFFCEYFHAGSDMAKGGAGGWETGELAALFHDGFDILRDEVVEDTADWGLRKTKLVRFVARKR